MDMLELYHVTKLQDFRSYPKFHIEYESKVDEINIEVRNWTQLNLVRYKSRVYRVKKFGIGTILSETKPVFQEDRRSGIIKTPENLK